MSEDALRAGPHQHQQQPQPTTTTTTTTTSHEFSNLSDTASQQTPVTPKSYHSTRSSFKKLPPPSLTTTCIYDHASSLDSSQSSLNPNNNTNDMPSVIVSPRVAIIDMPGLLEFLISILGKDRLYRISRSFFYPDWYKM
jgi:hypothetical protein